MKNGLINRSILSLVIVLVCGCGIKTQHETTCADYPKPLGFVSDYEHVFDSTQLQSLIAILSGYEATSTNEIAVATVSTIKPDKSIFDYSLQLARCWGVGKKDKDNVVLIVISKNLRQIHIQNGKGIEARLTNDETKHIIDSIIIPEMKAGNYYEGIKDGITAIKKELE